MYHHEVSYTEGLIKQVSVLKFNISYFNSRCLNRSDVSPEI